MFSFGAKIVSLPRIPIGHNIGVKMSDYTETFKRGGKIVSGLNDAIQTLGSVYDLMDNVNSLTPVESETLKLLDESLAAARKALSKAIDIGW